MLTEELDLLCLL